MPLINCKVELSLKWDENCILQQLIQNFAPIVTLSAEDNVKLSKFQNY